MTLAAKRNTGWIYVTNDTLPNPYGTLPTYWSQLVAAAAASPALTVQFGMGAGSSSGSFGPVINDGGGVYTATFTATTPGSPRTITATIDGPTVAAHFPTITVTLGLDRSVLNME